VKVSRIALPTPFPVGPVNSYLVGPEPLTLVDCGPLTDEAWEVLCGGIREAGAAVEAVERVVLSHPHHDHAGLARRVQDRSGCAILAHPADVPRLLGRPGEWEAVVDFVAEACRRAGAPAGVIGELREGFAQFARYAEPVREASGLEEGEVLAFSDGALETLHTPGHARGALCLWDPLEGTLLSGDTLIPHISSNPVLEPADGPSGEQGAFRQQSLPRYLASLRRIAALSPRAVLPGHGEPMGDPLPLIRERMAFHEARADRVAELVGEGPTTPWQVVRRLFPLLPPTQVFLGMSEVVGHLDLLVEQGRVIFEGQEGEWVARAP